MLSPADIADAVALGLRAHAAALDAEGAVRGLDALDELGLHPILAEALAAAGCGVHREQRYPADRGKRRRSEGERCDLVLTPDARDLRAPDVAGTLFDDPDATDLEDAFWLEVKTVSQFTPEGANRSYSSQLLSTVRRDVTKLSKEPGILHAGLLIVLFARDEQVTEHDLDIWHDRCLRRGLPVSVPARRHVPLTDRHGNAVATIAVYPVHHL